MKLGTLAAALVAAHAGILLAATGTAVPLQPAADDLRHVVVQGDTLYGLSQHYLASHQLWPALQRRNAIVDPLRLQPGQVVYIPAHLLPTHSVAATVDFVHGSVQTVVPPQPTRDTGRRRNPIARRRTAPGGRRQLCQRQTRRWLGDQGRGRG